MRRKVSARFVGYPNWFVSHAWRYKFLDAIKVTLVKLLGNESALQSIIWPDIFSLKQQGGRSDLSFEYLSSTYSKY